MKRIALLITLILLIAPQAFASSKTYGKGLQVKEITAVSAILDNPDDFIGKTVRIEGMIIEVCAKRGCWVYVAGDRQGEKIQVKVTDGEIVFPMSASGRMGVVEGVVEELKLSREQMIKYLQHLAEEKGQPFDPSTVKDERMIRLVGIGAEIEG
ncbi:MAG: DUF4920 domain-containing protein [Deltaproteobacteria bacterium]|nr:DUF4920 domain-containing protein [Deltaproteobacteria bacterium]